MGHGLEPCCPVDHGTEVVVVTLLARAGVQAHPHPDRPVGRPCLGAERVLGGEHGLQRLLRCGEGGAERVADGLEHVAAGLVDGRAEQLVVPAQRLGHLLRLGLPEPGGPLDVGEQQRDRSRGDRSRAAHAERIRRLARIARPGCAREDQAGPRIRPLVGTPVPAVTSTGPSPPTWFTEVPRICRTPSAMPFMPWMYASPSWPPCGLTGSCPPSSIMPPAMNCLASPSGQKPSSSSCSSTYGVKWS